MHAQAIKHEATELIGRWLWLSYPEKPMRVSLCPCCVCVAVPQGMEELWQLCCAVHLWWLPGSVGSQWKQQSIYSNSRVSWGGMGVVDPHTCTCFFPPYIMQGLVSSSSFCFSPHPCLFSPNILFPLSWPSCSESSLLAYWSPPVLFFPILPMPALSQSCLYMMAPVDTNSFHLETQMMCRC